jgi:flagellar basal-body rod protein FlgC
MDILFRSMEISASGLTAERFRMAVIANNLANLDTTAAAGGGPFQRQAVVVAERTAGPGAVFASLGGGIPTPDAGDGVQVVGIVTDTSPGDRAYDPGNPLADAQGYVTHPNVSPVVEMVDLMSAAQHYRANVTALEDAKDMVSAVIQVGRSS